MIKLKFMILDIILILAVLAFFPALAEIAAVIGLLYIGFWTVVYAIAIGYMLLNQVWFWGLLAISFFIFIFMNSNKKERVNKSVSVNEPKANNEYIEPVSDYRENYLYEKRGYSDDEEINDLMRNHDLDIDEAEHVKEIMEDEGLDEDEAVELKDEL